MKYGNWQPVIGLEIHAQLKTQSKLFSPDSTQFGCSDNENIHPISLGLPGTLPVLNGQAIDLAIRAGLALNCKINKETQFVRKNYFYPDLPKGYQISQLDEPICKGGSVIFFVGQEEKRVELTRAHLEEDAGKSIHSGDYSLINLNRAGIPLLEIVSEPQMHSPQEAAEYAKMVRRILKYVEVCDGNLEEGSLRCDCNVSVRQKNSQKLGTRVEIKNINSFRFVEKAIEYEIHRQIDCLESNEKIYQETRLYDSTKNKTYPMRSKEEAQDYRYFPEPDIQIIKIDEAIIRKIQDYLPELPLQRMERFQRQYKIPSYDSNLLTEERELADYFEQVTKLSGQAKLASNWIMSEILKFLNENNMAIKDCRISAEHLAKLIGMINENSISGKIGKKLIGLMWDSQQDPGELVKEHNLSQVSDESLILNEIQFVLDNNPSQVKEYLSGKQKLMGYFVGQLMQAMKGKADPAIVNKLLKQEINKR